VLGGGVAELLEGVAAVAEVLRAVGDQLQLAGLEMSLIVLPFRKCMKSLKTDLCNRYRHGDFRSPVAPVRMVVGAPAVCLAV